MHRECVFCPAPSFNYKNKGVGKKVNQVKMLRGTPAQNTVLANSRVLY